MDSHFFGQARKSKQLLPMEVKSHPVQKHINYALMQTALSEAWRGWLMWLQAMLAPTVTVFLVDLATRQDKTWNKHQIFPERQLSVEALFY